MKERLIKIMNDAGLNASQLADAVGIQRAAVSHIMAGRNNPSLDVISRVLKRFSYINPDWLLFGIGAMKREANGENYKPQSLFAEQSEAFAPLDMPVNKVQGQVQQQVQAQPQVQVQSLPPFAVEKTVETIKTVEAIDPDTHSKVITANYAANNNTLETREYEIREPEIREQTREYEIKEQLSPKIDRILIFYTDNTYATYVKV
ncbi:MAG: helix-turn-helix domain-containing protein [Tannerella sp.]|jgi:transcriptional regulator with XRE-family HTH domain|nr:helix-turn-helix domain-containing protein [Tannerella sp.]